MAASVYLSEASRGALVHKVGRKYDWLYLQSINSIWGFGVFIVIWSMPNCDGVYLANMLYILFRMNI
jgi:hypothetical protein